MVPVPEAGETLICRLDKGGKITVTLEDRVYPDASAGQYEAGWWVFEHDGTTATTSGDYPFRDYFLSEAGILYEHEFDIRKSGQGGFTKACGIHVPWARIVKQADMELENFIMKDELINRSFDAYR
jgi:hypothetical protein